MDESYESVDFWPDSKLGPWLLKTTYTTVGGRWECVGLEIRSHGEGVPQGEPVALTSSVLRALPLATLTAKYRREVRDHIKALVAQRLVSVEVSGRKLPAAEAEKLLARRSIGGELGRPAFWNLQRLEKAANVYSEALALGANPTMAVAKHFHKSPSMAAKVVAMARRATLLPSTSQGKAAAPPLRPLKETVITRFGSGGPKSQKERQKT